MKQKSATSGQIWLKIGLWVVICILKPPYETNLSDFLIEFDQTENALREDLTNPKIKMVNGKISVPKTPGLGLEVDENALALYTNKGNQIKDLEELIK